MSSTEPPLKRPGGKPSDIPRGLTPGRHKTRFPDRKWPNRWPKDEDGVAARLKGRTTKARITKAAAVFAQAGISADLDACGLPIDETAEIAAWITSDEYMAQFPDVDLEIVQ